MRRQLISAFREENAFWEQKTRDQWHRDTETQNSITPLQNNEELRIGSSV